MERIIDEANYNEKVEEFKKIYEDETVPLEEKIRMCEEFKYCDYLKGSGRIDFSGELIEMYYQAGYYRKVISFMNDEFKSHFKTSTEWWMFVTGLCPFLFMYVIDSEIALKEYDYAKGFLNAFKENREAMLKNNQDGPLHEASKYWYGRILAKCAQIEILAGDYSAAIKYLVDPFFNDFKNLESYYYMGIISLGEKDIDYKNISLAINCFTGVARLDKDSDDYTDDEKEMIVLSNYYLGLIYSKEEGFINKEKAIEMFNRAKDLGYRLTDEQISDYTENIEDEPSNSTDKSKETKSGCYIATAVYGSYDCPQVWTLRRYRDNFLSKKLYGRMFIKIYYAISPIIVKWYGNKEWFNKMWRGKLDNLVEKLKSEGYESTPYSDI